MITARRDEKNSATKNMHKQSITKLHDNIMMQVSAITIEVGIFGKE